MVRPVAQAVNALRVDTGKSGHLSILEFHGKLCQPLITDRGHHHDVLVFAVVVFGLFENAFFVEPDLLVNVNCALVGGAGLQEGAEGVRGCE